MALNTEAFTQPQSDYAVSKLNKRLGYGLEICKNDEKRKEKVKTIDNFLNTYAKGSRFPKPRGWNDISNPVYQESMLRMAREFLEEEGSSMWPRDQHHDLYRGELIWPVDRKESVFCSPRFNYVRVSNRDL